MKTGLRISPVMLAVILMAVCIVPALVLKDVSPSNELRYLSIADEALENGSVFTFSNHGEPYADKPPLYLWLVMLSRLLFGCHDTFVLSLLSFVPAMVTIAVMDRWLILVSRHSTLRFSSGERFAAAMMTGTSVMFLGSAVVLRMDMMMTMFIVLSLFTFYKMYRGIGNAGVQGILLPVYIFLALFTKGPVGLLMPVAGIAVFLLVSGKIRDIGKYLGIRTWGILALLCGLWFLGVWLEGGKDYLYNLLFHQTVDRAVNAFHHKRPFWYYLAAIWYVAAPYSIAMIYSMLSRSGRRGYVTDAGRLFLSCSLTVFVMLSAFSSKLAIYLLPMVPFMAYYTVLAGKQTGCNGMMRLALSVPSAILLLAAVAVCAFPLVSGQLPGLSSMPEDLLSVAFSANAYVAAAFLAAGACLSFIALFRKRSWTFSASSIAVSVLASVLVLTPLVPKLNDYIGYRNLCTAAKSLKDASGVSGYSVYGISRPENMDVWLGEDVKDFSGDPTGYWLPSASGTVLMMKTSELSEGSTFSRSLGNIHGVESGEYTLFVLKGEPGD